MWKFLNGLDDDLKFLVIMALIIGVFALGGGVFGMIASSKEKACLMECVEKGVVVSDCKEVCK